MVKAGLIAPRFTMREGPRILIPVDFSELPTEHPYTLMLSQADTERLLLERLHELGGEVIRPKTLSRIAQDADRRHGHLRRRRNHQGGLRRRSRRHAQHRSRTGRNRFRRRRIRRILRARRRSGVRRGAPRPGDPVLRQGRPERAGAAARRHLPHRRAGRGRTAGAVGGIRAVAAGQPGLRAGPHGGHRAAVGDAVPYPPPRRRQATAPVDCCWPATPPMCTARPAARA